MVALIPFVLGLVSPAHAVLPGDTPEVAAARKAAEQSILDGQRHLFKSKYWPTFTSKKTGFTVKIPSHEEATETLVPNDYVTYRYELGVPFEHRVYVMGVHTTKTIDPAKIPVVVESLANGKLEEFGAQSRTSTTWANGTKHELTHPKLDIVLGVRVDGSSIYQLWVTAPKGSMDATVVERIFDGFTPTPRTEARPK